MNNKWIVFWDHVDLWSWKIDLQSINDRLFQQAIEDVVFATQQNFLGFLSYDNWVETYTRTKYPRKKYWIHTDQEYKASTDLLAEKLWKNLIEETKENVCNRFRVILGLREWYGENNGIHQIQEVKNILWEQNLYIPWKVYSVINNRNSPILYTEPIVIIVSQAIDIERLIDWAEKLYQQRFTVEDFQERKAFTIETRFCEISDKQYV